MVQVPREQINFKSWLKCLSMLAWTCFQLPTITTMGYSRPCKIYEFPAVNYKMSQNSRGLATFCNKINRNWNFYFNWFFQAKLSLQTRTPGQERKKYFPGARLENCTSTKSLRHSKTLVVHPLTLSGGFSEGKTCQGSFSRHYYSDDRKFHPIFWKNLASIGICWGQSSQRC